MKKTLLLLLTLSVCLSTYGQGFGQNQRNGRQQRSGIPQTNSEPSEKDIADHKRKMEERKQEFIANFLTTLEADDFQKEIIKQNINTFFDAKVAVFKNEFEHSIDRETAVKHLEDNHFKDLEALISEADMEKIKTMISGGFDEKEVKKKKKKRRKRKKDNN